MEDKEQVSVTMPADTWSSLLTVLKVAAEREADDGHTELAEELVSVYDQLERAIQNET